MYEKNCLLNQTTKTYQFFSVFVESKAKFCLIKADQTRTMDISWVTSSLFDYFSFYFQPNQWSQHTAQRKKLWKHTMPESYCSSSRSCCILSSLPSFRNIQRKKCLKPTMPSLAAVLQLQRRKNLWKPTISESCCSLQKNCPYLLLSSKLKIRAGVNSKDDSKQNHREAKWCLLWMTLTTAGSKFESQMF